MKKLLLVKDIIKSIKSLEAERFSQIFSKMKAYVKQPVAYTLIKYDSRVVSISNLLVITSLES